MTTSTRTLVPEPRAGSGSGACAEPVAYSEATQREILARAARTDYDRWAEQVERCGGCSRPIRLKGNIVTHTTAGPVVTYTTRDEPDGELMIRCGNRRASVCPSCAFEYAGDTWHLIYAGLAGGHKGVPAAIAEHPKVFASLTAPSFGAVHTTPNDKNGRRAPCRPRSKKTLCEHGRPTWCMRRHADDDPHLGEPLCRDCYDYTAAAAFNWVAPELWRRFTIALARALAKLCDLSATAWSKLLAAQFAKVAEFQRRGLVHFHAVIRIDGRPAKGDPGQWPAPPIDISAELLAVAVRQAAAHVSVTVRADDRDLVLRFGEQVDAQPINRRPDLDTGELRAEHVAAYVAKYATKAAEDLGLGERRQVPDLHHARHRGLSGHVLRHLEAVWELGESESFAGIRRWLHMLGFRGHFSSKSRRYSTTLGAIRGERRAFRVAQEKRRTIERGLAVDPARADDPDTADSTLVVGTWEFAGIGHRSSGDAALAASAAARAREHRRLVAEHRRTECAA
jgi:hypothetical protein